MDQTVVGTEQTEQEIPAWKIKRTENLAKARLKADELRKEIREATGAKPIGKQKLKTKLAILKNEGVTASTAEVVVEADTEPVESEQPEAQPEPEQSEPDPKVDLKKSIRPKAKKQPKIVVSQEESEEEDDEEEEEVASVSNFTEAKPKIIQGLDGLWYF
jgi:hypothetical protein